MYDGLVTQCDDGAGDLDLWRRSFNQLQPGATVLVNVRTPGSSTAIHLRRAGFERRDTIYSNCGQSNGIILFCRKPLEESSVLRQVLRTGTGAVNLGATRVKGIRPVITRTRSYRRFDNKYHDNDSKGNAPTLVMPTDVSDGRWPPNYMFLHAAGCQKAGVICHGGMEADKYACAVDCPIPLLEAQSAACGVVGTKTVDGHADDGAAARFFTQFLTEGEIVEWLRILATTPGGKILDPFG